MSWKVKIYPRTLHFKEPAGTSRGVYLTHEVWYVTVDTSDGTWGVGECAPLPGLSIDAGNDYASRLHTVCQAIEKTHDLEGSVPLNCPSMRFGLETALLHAKAGSIRFFDSPFSQGKADIPINGLVWMGSHAEMLRRMEEKIRAGFRCIKLKIGAIDFSEECDLMRRIRERWPSPKELELRLDANGGFTPQNARQRLDVLASFAPHSLEQPIRQGQWKQMAELCKTSPVPIALDEELIPVTGREEKEAMLDTIHPRYIILKPTLHGGLKGADEWIRLADERGIGHWATSALESNIGLNAIAQWCGKRGCTMPQGLGTGQLFTDNIEDYPLIIRQSSLHFTPDSPEPDLRGYLGRTPDVEP